MLINGSNVLPSNGFLDGGESDVHTYLLEKVGVIRRHVDELGVLDEVVRLHLLVSFQVEMVIVITFLHRLFLLLFLLFRRLGFFIFMHRAIFELGVVRARASTGAT